MVFSQEDDMKPYVLLTGASGKVGRKIVKHFIYKNVYSLILQTFQNSHALNELTKDSDGMVQIIETDLRTQTGLQKLSTVIERAPGCFKGFIHCASLFEHVDWKELKWETFTELMHLHAWSAFEIIRRIITRACEGMRIILFTDAGIDPGYPGYPAYTASKSVLSHWVALFSRILPDHMTIHGIAPYKIIDSCEGKKNADPYPSFDSIVALVDWIFEHGSGASGTIITFPRIHVSSSEPESR